MFWAQTQREKTPTLAATIAPSRHRGGTPSNWRRSAEPALDHHAQK
jgi:hypothetical protein